MKEIWKDIPNYEGLYQASNLGNIRSLKNRWGNRIEPRLVKQQKTNKGYKRVRLSKKNKSKTFMVHRIIYITFIKDIENGLEINHKDFNRENNKINNSEMITHTNNVRYSKAKQIIQLSLNNEYIRQWDCIHDVKRAIGLDPRQICACLLGKQKTCHGSKRTDEARD